MNTSASTSSSSETFSGPNSAELSKQIAQVIPGGVDSPFRSFKEVGGHTIFFKKGAGSKLYDVDGNEFVDLLGAWGPAILGYCHPDIVAACQKAVLDGPVFGAPHEFELELAKLLIDAVPSMEMVRFVNSGTEAVMSAVRLARGFTDRPLIVMFEGHYHGHSDSVLASRDHSSSTGIPPGVSENTLLVPFNDEDALRTAFGANADRIAAVLIEPVAGSMGVVPPAQGYLQAVAKLCSDNGALLIFDEVLTGLRVGRGGAQELYGVRPDLTCLGKALGGGMPIGAYGGRKEIMHALEPLGKVYQAGTFSGNPVTMAGGIATLRLLRDGKAYLHMEQMSARFFDGLQRLVDAHSWPITLQRVGSMFSIIFSATPVRNFKDSQSIDSATFSSFYHQLLMRGVYLAPSSVDACAISAVHSAADIDYAVTACEAAFKRVF